MSPFLKITLSVFTILTITGLVFLLIQQPEVVSTNFFLSPLGKEKPSPTPSPKKPDTEKLVLDIKNYLATQSGTWGIAITQLTDNRQLSTDNRQPTTVNLFGLNLEKQFPAASLMKVLVAANLIHRVDKNEFSLKNHAPEQGSVDGHELNSVLVHGKIEGKTLADLMKSMINRTDNDAWYTLNHFLGFNNLQKFGEDLGMKNFSISKNTISPADMNLLLASIYQNEIASVNYCQLLISHMENTETEDRIPAAIQQEFTLRPFDKLVVVSKVEPQAQGDRPSVYHKAGTWSETGTYSDAGIIEAKNPFILTILSENAPSRSRAITTIKIITKKVLVALTKY